MIFQYTLDDVLSSHKTQTRRIIKDSETVIRTRYNRVHSVLHNGRLKWEVGKTYSVQPHRTAAQVARIRITRITQQIVSRISTEDAIAEGFASREEFLDTWTTIHGSQSLDCKVWAIEFELDSLLVPETEFIRAREKAYAYR